MKNPNNDELDPPLRWVDMNSAAVELDLSQKEDDDENEGVDDDDDDDDALSERFINTRTTSAFVLSSLISCMTRFRHALMRSTISVSSSFTASNVAGSSISSTSAPSCCICGAK